MRRSRETPLKVGFRYLEHGLAALGDRAEQRAQRARDGRAHTAGGRVDDVELVVVAEQREKLVRVPHLEWSGGGLDRDGDGG